jgi:hypothetical protein
MLGVKSPCKQAGQVRVRVRMAEAPVFSGKRVGVVHRNSASTKTARVSSRQEQTPAPQGRLESVATRRGNVPCRGEVEWCEAGAVGNCGKGIPAGVNYQLWGGTQERHSAGVFCSILQL